jgi:lipopolysaccharide transport system ATP-binding protein
MYGTNTQHTGQIVNNIKAGAQCVFNINFVANLGSGNYSVQTALVSSDSHLENNYEWRDLALVFNVINMTKTKFAGSSWIEPEIEVIF